VPEALEELGLLLLELSRVFVDKPAVLREDHTLAVLLDQLRAEGGLELPDVLVDARLREEEPLRCMGVIPELSDGQEAPKLVCWNNHARISLWRTSFRLARAAVNVLRPKAPASGDFDSQLAHRRARMIIVQCKHIHRDY